MVIKTHSSDTNTLKLTFCVLSKPSLHTINQYYSHTFAHSEINSQLFPIMYSFYGVLSVLLPSINGRWPRFISQWGPCTGLFDVRSRCHSTQRAGDELIRRPNELREDLVYAQLPVDDIRCCCVTFSTTVCQWDTAAQVYINTERLFVAEKTQIKSSESVRRA